MCVFFFAGDSLRHFELDGRDHHGRGKVLFIYSIASSIGIYCFCSPPPLLFFLLNGDSSCNAKDKFVMPVLDRYLKERSPSVRVVLADPAKSHLAALVAARDDPAAGAAALAAVDAAIGATGGVQVEGAGKASLTGIMQGPAGASRGGGGGRALVYVDQAVAIDDFDAFDECRQIAKVCGLLVGGSAGLNVAASKVSHRCESPVSRPGTLARQVTKCEFHVTPPVPCVGITPPTAFAGQQRSLPLAAPRNRRGRAELLS